MSSEEKLTAIVTGGAQGLGRAISDALLNNGYKVCIADVNESVGNDTKEDLSKKYGTSNVIFVTCDVTREADFTKVFEEVIRTFGRINLLVNNAGVSEFARSSEEILMINLYGTILGCQAAMKFMGKDNGGRGGTVINIASVRGLVPSHMGPVYSATKHGIVGLTRSFGTPFHYDKNGIVFSALCPGAMRTPLMENNNKVAPQYIQSVIQNRGMMEPETAAKGVLKLLEDQRNGAILMITERFGLEYIDIGQNLQHVIT